MTRSKHTSGMWETIDHNETPTIIANMDGWMEDGRMHYAYDVIAQCCDEFGDVLPNANANARLIEAAPDMLNALEKAYAHFMLHTGHDCWDDDDDDILLLIFDAIRRAKGAN